MWINTQVQQFRVLAVALFNVAENLFAQMKWLWMCVLFVICVANEPHAATNVQCTQKAMSKTSCVHLTLYLWMLLTSY